MQPQSYDYGIAIRTSRIFNPRSGRRVIIALDHGIALGADMEKICMIFGQSATGKMMENFTFIAQAIEDCHRVGLPVMVEPTTWGLRFESNQKKDPKILADMARIAFEIGADIVKSDFPDDPR